MKKIKQALFVLTGIITLTSFTIVHKKPDDATTIPSAKVTAVTKAINDAKIDGNISREELKNIFVTAKGRKLSLRDKIVLKLFGKKIAAHLMVATNGGDSDGKSQLVALLLCFFFGGIGIHRFYLGYTWQGIVQIVTLGGLGIWALIDFVRIIMGTLKPKDGDYGTTL